VGSSTFNDSGDGDDYFASMGKGGRCVIMSMPGYPWPSLIVPSTLDMRKDRFSVMGSDHWGGGKAYIQK